MLHNYLRIALRTMARQKGYAFINIAGLGVGMAAFVIITLFVVGERAADTHHPVGERVYQVQLSAAVMGQDVWTANSPPVMAGAFLEAFPEVVGTTRIDDFARVLVSHGDQQFYEPAFFLADSSVFDLFAVPLVQGEAATALNRPHTLVVSEATAQKYFGHADPIGQVLRVDNRTDYEVTGVFRTDPRSAHFAPELIGSFLSRSDWDDPVWLNNSYFTYVLLAEDADPGAFAAKLPGAVRTFLAAQIEQFMGQPYDQALANGFRYDWVIQALPDLYLHNQADDQMGRSGDARYVYILAAIALFVLLIACVNFMNLATARASRRAREVGLRKVMGSERGQLVGQFLGEAVVMALLGMVLAGALVVLTLPLFNTLAGVTLRLVPWVPALMLGIALGVGLLAGAYPAFVLSSFKPVEVLKGSFAQGGRGIALRRALVVFQFAVSITLIVSTLVVYQQMQYMQSRDLGFVADQIVVLPIETSDGVRDFPTFRDEILQHPGVRTAAGAGILPGQNHIHNVTAFRSEAMTQDQFMLAAAGEVTSDYVETLGLTVVAGRDFDDAFETDAEGWMINEAAAAELGFITPEDAVGQRVMRPQGGPDNTDRWGTIVGVLQDAHYESLHRPIGPLIFGRGAFNQRYIPVRLAPDRIAETMAFLEDRWTAYQPGFPFQYYFMDDDYQALYEQETRLGRLYLLFAVLAIVIACLGLFGLASYVTAARTKEIGVRKVLGASVVGIVGLLSKEFTLLVLLACAVAFPVGYLMMDRWLADFAYATALSPWVFVGAALLALLIAWATVGYQALRAATADPVRSLRYE